MNEQQRMIQEALDALRRYSLSQHANVVQAELERLRGELERLKDIEEEDWRREESEWEALQSRIAELLANNARLSQEVAKLQEIVKERREQWAFAMERLPWYLDYAAETTPERLSFEDWLEIKEAEWSAGD